MSVALLKSNAALNQHKIPYDVLWLDIELTDGKRYFTWEPIHFSSPTSMQENLSIVGRKVVTIVDPHIKIDPAYYVHSKAESLGYYVKDEYGDDFHGWCWPGDSSYLDFMSHQVRCCWALLFRYETYAGSTSSLYTWNDMNEPSEWSIENGTICMDSIARKRLRKDNRSFFAGSQTFRCHLEWREFSEMGNLKYTTMVLLSMLSAGLTFVGADIGGFFGNPDTDLLTRWFQAVAYQPFFRGHAYHDSVRREPWVFGEPHTSHIRSAIRERYSLLPQLYTLFYIYEILQQEDAFLLGSDLLIHPVVELGITSISVFLASHSFWSSVFQYIDRTYSGLSTRWSFGTRKRRLRRISALMLHDPVSVLITLDANVSAKGQLYLNDERTFAYKLSNRFTLVHLECTMSMVQLFVSANGYGSSIWVERIEIYAFGALYKVPTNILRAFEAVSALISAKTNVKEDDMESGVSYQQLDFTYDPDLDQLVVWKPALKLHEVWKLQFHYGDR
ncbi:unnamed protein product [Albugo candida]|uniref:Glycoside hydrolase family 31 TIM barrel domain-containing protein n=1 Tax=Albugo candida TaxID=65357 RepID=A0A024FY02_9STRA|nr:unnamed protein product [Albugo candida]|eukprot:CCI11524.1 unnamed protein product [Albugo candida]